MKLGAEQRNRVVILAVLILVAGYVLYSNVFSGSSESSAPSSPRTAAPAAAPVSSTNAANARAEKNSDRVRRTELTRGGDWNPGIGDTPSNPLKVDPTLRLDLLAKVQQAELATAQRNLFQYGAIAPLVDTSPIKNPGKIDLSKKTEFVGPRQPPPPPGPPTAPQITMKYYGYTSGKASGRKRAFFLDGDEIIVASEGETLKKGRYKLVKIGVNSVTMEDTEFKSEQTLPLVEALVG